MPQQQPLRILLYAENEERIHSIRKKFGDSISVVCAADVAEAGNPLVPHLCEEIRKTQAHLLVIDGVALPETKETRQALLKAIDPRRSVILHQRPEADLEVIFRIQQQGYWMIYDHGLENQSILPRLHEIAVHEGEAKSEIENPQTLRQYAQTYFERLSDGEGAQITLKEIENEFQELLKRLFPHNPRLSIEPLPGQSPSGQSITSGVPRSRSLVFLVEFNGERLPAVVKIARKEKIRREAKHFRDNVEFKVGGLRHAVIEKEVLLWNLGAIAYSFVGVTNAEIDGHSSITIPTLTSFLRTTSRLEIISDLIRNLFSSWKRQYRQQKEVETNERLYEQYNAAWDGKLELFLNRFPSLPQPAWTFDSADLPDPLSWLREHRTNTPFARRPSIIHGDMHADNIFVDRDSCWFIDFERSTHGPELQDFVELEVDLITRLIDINPIESPHRELFYEFLIALCNHSRPDAPIDFSERAAQDSQNRKFTNILAVIRKKALELTGYQDARHYLWGLLLNATFRAAYSYADPHRQHLYNRSFLLAAFLCRRLDGWQSIRKPPVWPPQGWPSVDLRPDDPQPEDTTSESSDIPDYFEHGYALLIGVGETPHIPRLSLDVTTRDTAALQQVLMNQERCGYLPHNVRMVNKGIATGDQIRHDLDWLRRVVAADPSATAIVYYSGHGFRDPGNGSGERYGIIPSDVRLDETRQLDQKSVLWASELIDLLNAIGAKRLLVLIDACHAEGMTSKNKDELAFLDGLSKSPPPQNLLEQLNSGEGRVVISSCTGEQKSWIRPDNAMSIFSHHLIEALEGRANSIDGEIRVSDILQYISRAVPQMARELCGQEQTPFTESKGTDFPIALQPKSKRRR